MAARVPHAHTKHFKHAAHSIHNPVRVYKKKRSAVKKKTELLPVVAERLAASRNAASKIM